MQRIIYSADGMSWRRADHIRIDKRDLLADGAPHPAAMALPVGQRIADHEPGDGHPGFAVFEHPEPLQPGEIVFDHVLDAAELEQHFPGHAARVQETQRVNALRKAIGMGAHDDEIATHVAADALKASDLQDLAEINARLALRGKPQIP